MPQLVNEANVGRKNPDIKNKIRIVKGMVEEEKVHQEVLRSGKVDTIISEPIGVMLFHERMVTSNYNVCSGNLKSDRFQVESFLLARDLFLKPGGQLLPSAGTIFFCPFTDSGLYAETEAKVGRRIKISQRSRLINA
jgi:histone-arginine methyltransferase CARM1